MATYRNPWHNPHRSEYGPEEYWTDATPTEYRGYMIYHRQSNCWDVVKDHCAIAQRAGYNGAKNAIDTIIAANGTAGIVCHPSEEYEPEERAMVELPLFAST